MDIKTEITNVNNIDNLAIFKKINIKFQQFYLIFTSRSNYLDVYIIYFYCSVEFMVIFKIWKIYLRSELLFNFYLSIPLFFENEKYWHLWFLFYPFYLFYRVWTIYFWKSTNSCLGHLPPNKYGTGRALVIHVNTRNELLRFVFTVISNAWKLITFKFRGIIVDIFVEWE